MRGGYVQGGRRGCARPLGFSLGGTTGGRSWARGRRDLRNTAKGAGSPQTPAWHNAPQQPSPGGGAAGNVPVDNHVAKKTSISPKMLLCCVPQPRGLDLGLAGGRGVVLGGEAPGGLHGAGEGSVGFPPPRCRSQKRRGTALGTGTAGRLDCVPRGSHGMGWAAGPRAGPGPPPGTRTGRHWRKEPQGQRPVGTTGLRDPGAWCLATSAPQLHPSPNQRWCAPSPQPNVSVNTFGQTRAKRVGGGAGKGKIVVILNQGGCKKPWPHVRGRRCCPPISPGKKPPESQTSWGVCVWGGDAPPARCPALPPEPVPAPLGSSRPVGNQGPAVLTSDGAPQKRPPRRGGRPSAPRGEVSGARRSSRSIGSRRAGTGALWR